MFPATLLTLMAGSVAAAFFGLLDERVGSRSKEVFSSIILAIALYTLYNLYVAVDGGVVVFTIGAGPPLAACFEVDALSVFMAACTVFLALLCTVYSARYMEHDTRLAEYYSLLLSMTAGMVGVAFAGDMFTLFVFWELMCISSYVLVAFRKERWAPIEAGFKYLIMSAIGATMILFGMAFLYGMTGTLNFAQMSETLSEVGGGFWVLVAFAALFIGFGIKAAVVPMHTWLPDAHPEAPSPISAMLSGMVIETGLYGFIRLLYVVFIPNAAMVDGGLATFKVTVGFFAAVTMIVGNVMALLQKDIKRLLAYSSIAQIGYMLIGVAAATEFGLRGCFLHVLNHSLMKGLAFLAAGAIVHQLGTRNLDEIKGVGKRMPITMMTLTIAVLGLGGVPGTAGFISKFILFASAVGAGMPILTVLGVLNSAFSMAYYLPMLKNLVTTPTRDFSQVKEAPASMLVPMCIMAALIILIGIYPAPAVQFAHMASEAVTTKLSTYIEAIVRAILG